MGSSDGQGLSQLYLELTDAGKKRFMPQDGQGTALKCSPIWKEMRKVVKYYLNLSSSSSPKPENGKLFLTRPPLKVFH